MNSEPTDDNHAIIKNYVDSSFENNRSRRDLWTVFEDQGHEFDKNEVTNLDSLTFDRNPLLDEKASSKIYNNDELDKKTILKFNQTLEIYLKVSVGNDVCGITKQWFKAKRKIKRGIIKVPNNGIYLLQKSNK